MTRAIEGGRVDRVVIELEFDIETVGAGKWTMVLDPNAFEDQEDPLLVAIIARKHEKDRALLASMGEQSLGPIL